MERTLEVYKAVEVLESYYKNWNNDYSKESRVEHKTESGKIQEIKELQYLGMLTDEKQSEKGRSKVTETFKVFHKWFFSNKNIKGLMNQ